MAEQKAEMWITFSKASEQICSEANGHCATRRKEGIIQEKSKRYAP